MFTTTKITASLSTVLLAGLGLTSVTHADPLSGEVLKFQQLPINNLNLIGDTTTYQGRDQSSTAVAITDPTGFHWSGGYAADDFSDKVSTPVVHLSWWGSYINDTGAPRVQQFLISFESDVPAVPGLSASHPGTPLLNQIVTAGALSPGSGTFTETLENGAVPEHLYKYNAELALPFPEQADTVYWLKIVALTDNPDMNWGWHDRDYTQQDTLASAVPSPGENVVGLISGTPVWHFQDDAVTGRVTITPSAVGPLLVDQGPEFFPQNYEPGYDGPSGIENFSKDLAFELYTPVPEPTSLAALPLCAVAMLRRRRR